MKNAPAALRQNGLSLIELMVALVIGLVAALIPARQAMRVKIIEGLRQAG